MLRPAPRPQGFTKIELLIVFAVAAVLAAIVYPNLQEGPSGSYVSRVKNDMRSLATGLETYFEDHKGYPPMVPLRVYAKDLKALEAAGGAQAPSLFTGDASGQGITTPVSYVTSLFPDRFATERGLPFAYYTDGSGWLLYSAGPDSDYDLNPSVDYDSSIPQPSPHLLLKAYDPTNGTVSGGDIFRVKQ